MKWLWIFCGGWLTLMMSACSPVDTQATLEANRNVAGTQVAQIRTTATVQAARLQTTLDFTGTQAAFSATQSRFLKATLISRGTPESELRRYQQLIMGPTTPTVTPSPTLNPTLIGAENAEGAEATADVNAPPTITPTVTPIRSPTVGPTPTSTRPGVTPLAAVITPTQPRATATNAAETTADPNAGDGVQLLNPRLGTTLNDNECVRSEQIQFSTDVEEIYISVRVQNAPEGTAFVSRWSLRGDELVSFDYVPDFAIDGRCIWFFIDESDVTFQPGEWSVIIEVNGSPAIAPQSFTMTEP